MEGSIVRVGLIGFGTVGSGVVKILFENRETIRKRTGFEIELKKIADLDIETDRNLGFEIPRHMLTTNAEEIINDPDIDIVVELIGGIEPAKTFILSAIDKGKSVVTANKKLLAESGAEIFEKAKEKNVELGFEASVGGGIPIIKAIKESFVGNNIRKVYGILNGTANYILTKMSKEGSSYEDALRDAQEKGFAEADPTLDVKGIDAAHKLAILAMISFGIGLNFDELYREGIDKIMPIDISFADEFGYTIKLLSIAKNEGSSVEVRVHPTLIPSQHLLSKIDWEYNAIYVDGDAVEKTLFYGKGAGMMPTGSAVVADIVDVARNIVKKSLGRVPILSFCRFSHVKIKPVDDLVTPYYIRFQAMDRPGVLSKISGILGKENISISQVIQKGRSEKGVPIVMITHHAREKSVRNALKEIGKLDVVLEDPFYLRIEEFDE